MNSAEKYEEKEIMKEQSKKKRSEKRRIEKTPVKNECLHAHGRSGLKPHTQFAAHGTRCGIEG